MKKILVISLAIMLFAPVRANAFSWGDFFKTLFDVSSQETTTETTLKENVEKTLKENLSQVDEIDKTTQSSFLYIVSKLSGATELKTINSKLETANKIKDENEKIKAINQVYTDYSTVINNNKLEIVLIAKLLTDSEKETLKVEINNIYDNSNKYVELGKKNIKFASEIMKKAGAEDDRVTLLTEINTVSESINNSAKATLALSRQTKILASLAGIKF